MISTQHACVFARQSLFDHVENYLRIMPGMKEIPEIMDAKPGLKTFLIQVNIDIAELNLLIDKYNKMSDEPEQIGMLQQIYRLMDMRFLI